MNNGRTLTLNDKGILLIGTIILALTFALGYEASIKKQGQEVTIFTRDDLERIASMQEIEDKAESGAEIFAYKDKNGNLMIGWDYDQKGK